ncbi:MAG: polysaccharide deacetylase family protein [Solirubrobacteraceae bacterium]
MKARVQPRLDDLSAGELDPDMVIPPVEHRCALTFDDGPDPVWTPAVLTCLREHGLAATFFVIGARAQAAPALIARVLEAGHEVGLHCMHHVRHTGLSEAELAADTDAALEALARIGVRPSSWRAPWGVHTEASHSVAAQHNLELIGWSADTHDWRGDRATQMHAAVAPLLHDGSIVLMHDGIGPGARRDGCAQTVELTRLLSQTLARQATAAVSVRELRS